MLCLSGFELYSRWVPLNTSHLAIEVSFAVSLRSYPVQRSHSQLNFQYFDLHSFVGKSKGTLLAVNNLQRDSTPRYTHISSVNKANPEKI